MLRDGDVVAGAGWTIEAVHTPGHTSNHLCFALREEAALFSGDHVMGWSTSVITPPDGDMVAFLASLRRLLERDDVSYWPTHGPQITDPKALVRAYLDHRQERTAQVVAALADGPASLTELVPRIYADVAKTLWVPAAMSTHAHLLQLVDEGRVRVDRRRATQADRPLRAGRRMKIEAVELVRFSLPLVTPFRTSFGVQDGRDVILVRVVGARQRGLGRERGRHRAALLGRVHRRVAPRPARPPRAPAARRG